MAHTLGGDYGEHEIRYKIKNRRTVLAVRLFFKKISNIIISQYKFIFRRHLVGKGASGAKSVPAGRKLCCGIFVGMQSNLCRFNRKTAGKTSFVLGDIF